MAQTTKSKLTREQKAAQMYSEGVIVTRTPDGYEVPGPNGNVYEITETEDGCLFCTCPDAIYRSHQGEMCKHTLLVERVRKCLPISEVDLSKFASHRCRVLIKRSAPTAPVIDHDIHLKRERVVV